MHKVLFSLACAIALAGCSSCRREPEGNGNATAVGSALKAGCNKDCRKLVQAARRRLQPFTEDILPHVERQYRELTATISLWRFYARRCPDFAVHFRQVAELTLYPASFIGGIALHESRCEFGASDAAGGRGFMQITHVDRRRHLEPIATMLHVPVEQLDYRSNVLHNVLVGVMVLDDYERRFNSRPHGLLAYNMGPSGVKRAIRRSGQSGLPSVAELMTHLAYSQRMKPRVYVPRVLASVVLYDRTARGAELNKPIGPEDIPGWNPADDGS